MHTHLVSFVELSYIYSSSASVAWKSLLLALTSMDGHLPRPFISHVDVIVSPFLGQCSMNDDHHTSIYLQLNDYNSILEQNMTLYECLRQCTGMGDESRVTRMKNYAWWPCHKYDVNYMIMQGNMTMMERVIINETMESCMAIYLGMAMEMP